MHRVTAACDVRSMLSSIDEPVDRCQVRAAPVAKKRSLFVESAAVVSQLFHRIPLVSLTKADLH